MGKLTSFASGVGSGYLASERLKRTEKRQDLQDSWLKKQLGLGASRASDPSLLSPDPLELMSDKEREEAGLANGGMVGIRGCADMPNHWDKMDWQRQSFKK